MTNLLDTLQAGDIKLESYNVGKIQCAHDGWVHCKTVPYTIIAQVIHGHYVIHCPDRSAVIQPGQAFLTNANLPLRIIHHCDPRHRTMTARYLHFHFILLGALDFTALLDMPLCLSEKVAAPFEDLIEELLSVDAGPRTLCQLARRHELLLRALRLLCEAVPPRPDYVAFMGSTKRLIPVLAHIREHLADPIKVKDLACRAHLSPSRFYTYFKHWIGRSPMDHVKHLRLTEACRRLAVTDDPLRVIADDTGFCNPFHLSREFKSLFGQSPAAYRKAYDRSLG